MIKLEPFQDEAVDSAVNLFVETDRQLRLVETDPRAKRQVISNNGCVLLEAPTGAGKTLIAGRIAEKISKRVKVIWFWFAPFSGLTGQSTATIISEFPGLRPRDIKRDRFLSSSKSGDTFVMTWATVATRNAESRKARTATETMPSLDDLIMLYRAEGYRIGCIVDEAHHSFGKAQESQSFYSGTLAPEFTVLVTATPKDADITKFQEAVGMEYLHRISISRQDCVDAGLVKRGVRVVAFLADEASHELVDYELTALTFGLRVHRGIESNLKDLGITLKPLLLVQVDSRLGSVEDAKRKLIELGEKAESIAVHTADEPDPNLLALAADERISVLIFKMAVALGFDAPRAFTLVSMRHSRDIDFGVQIVGRILRVDRRLRFLDLPNHLNYGYVFLADKTSQTGLTMAADRINALKTEIGAACPNVTIIEGSQGPLVVQGQDIWATFTGQEQIGRAHV